MIAHWEQSRAGGGIDPTSHSAEIYDTVTSLTGRVALLETNVGNMKDNLDVVRDTCMAADAQDRVTVIESRSLLVQRSVTATAARMQKQEAQAAKDKRDIASIMRASVLQVQR